MSPIAAQQTGAYMEEFTLPPSGNGPLTGLRFAVKDLIDVAGHRTGCGNPDWLATHPPARVSAICVEQLLAAGAACVGKTISDEIAFSLLGENIFYGTPLNPAAPDRVPGGSSSGSASAVARGLVDFALGTDTGGSVRIPASYCGLWGMRPTHGITSLAGVMPFSPSFDTIGVLARTADLLERAMGVLLGRDALSVSAGLSGATVDLSRGASFNDHSAAAPPSNVFILSEPLALCDADVRQSLNAPLDRIRATFPGAIRETSLPQLLQDARASDLSTWLNTFRTLRSAEVDSCLGPWVEAVHPKFGPSADAGFAIIRQQDRSQIGPAMYERELLAGELHRALGPRDLICLPTAPTIAPLKGTASHDRHGDFYSRTLALTSIAGVGRLPQISMPLANVSGVPVGLSLIGPHDEEVWLLQIAQRFT
jgi:amidase